MKQRIQLSDHFDFGRLLRFTLPSIGMMVVNSVYVVVDGFFVSNYTGKDPFVAVNLIFPMLMILATVGFMFGTGGSALVAKTFGEGRPERANEYFSLFVYVSAALGVLFSVLGFFFIRPIAILLGAEGSILEYAVLYGRILLIALPFNVLQLVFQSFFITAERPQLGLFTMISSGVTNILLDVILVIFLPQQYKLAGAAIATAMSQVVGGTIPLFYFGRKNTSILRLCKTKLDLRALLKAATNGSSEFMSNVSMNLVGMLYNSQLLHYSGEDGVAAYGVMMYVSYAFAAVFIGYSIGVAPVVGYHDGAQNHHELKGLLRRSIILIGGFGVVMTAIALIFASPLSRIFVGYDPELLKLTVEGFRIFSLSFILMGYAIFSSSFFTALNDGITSAIISFLRTLVFQVLAVLLLPVLVGVDGIWWSIVVAELMAVIFSGAFLLSKRKKYHYF